MDGPNSPGRRTLLKAGVLTLATPVIGAVAQPAPSHQEAVTFNLWVISDSHVGADRVRSRECRAASAVRHLGLPLFYFPSPWLLPGPHVDAA